MALQTRTINIDLKEQTQAARLVRFLPELTGFDGEVLLQKEYSVTTNSSGVATIALPVKSVGTITYKVVLPSAKGTSVRSFRLSAGNAVDLSEVLEFSVSASDTVLDKLNQQKLGDHADVTLTTPANGHALVYDSTSHEWVNSAIDAEIADGAVTSSKIANGAVTTSKLGGDITTAGKAILDDADAAAQRATLGLGNVDNTSDVNKPVSTAAQSALDGKVDKNASVTGATKTKITYDSKGLVTAGADLSDSDLPTGINVNKLANGNVSNTEFQYLDGVTSAIQTQLDGKSATGHTHTASSVTDFDSATDARITAQKAQANGLATLDSGSKIPTNQLPGLALTTVSTVSSQSAQLALTAQQGDVAIRTDLNKSYVHNGGTAGTMADWSELLTPTDTVTSVAGKTGTVTLDKSDVGLGNVDNTSDTNKPISSATSTALSGKEPTITAGTTGQYWRGDKSWQALDKSAVGLANVDNTSDANKPVSSATQTALDGKVTKNADITGATKTKITYDAKGLITSGADATTADIADSTNKRYVTDAQSTVLGNTSGTNTGDQLVFKTISVSGQSDVVAGTTTDTVTFASSGNLAITTNASTDTVTFTGTEPTQAFIIPCSDETTALTTGTAKATFRAPYPFVLTDVRASLSTAQASGSIFTVDVNSNALSILSTKLTVDNTEKTSVTAATPKVFDAYGVVDNAEVTVDIDQVGDGTAKGLKLNFIGYKYTPTPLLDTYTDAAVAFSVRKLKSSYTGSALRVRRSSDNTEQDIGFDSSGNLDESALTTFVGANSGYVTKWYDQSGNGRHAEQTTSANQPRIVNAGTVEKSGNRVAIRVTKDTSQRLVTSYSNLQPLPVSILLVTEPKELPTNIYNNASVLIEGTSSTYLGRYQIQVNSSTFTAYRRESTVANLGGSTIRRAVLNVHFRSSGIAGRDTGTDYSEVAHSGIAYNVSSNFSIGGSGAAGAGGFTATSLFQEWIVYTADKWSDRASIEFNVNNYYSIY